MSGYLGFDGLFFGRSDYQVTQLTILLAFACCVLLCCVVNLFGIFLHKRKNLPLIEVAAASFRLCDQCMTLSFYY